MEFINDRLLPYISKDVLPLLDGYVSRLPLWIKDVNRTQIASIVVTFAVCYLGMVRRYRYQYINELRRKYPDPDIALKDSKVAAEVFDITFRREFPGTECMILFFLFVCPINNNTINIGSIIITNHQLTTIPTIPFLFNNQHFTTMVLN